MFTKSIYFTVVWALCCLVSTAGAQGEKGEILFEYWDGIGGTLDSLYNSDKWPDQPDRWEYRSSLEGETDQAETYSTRVRGFVYPPQTGTYSFWIASDDGSELWLSQSDDPGSAVVIANVPEWTTSQEWTKFPSQQSSAIHLEANTPYYIEARHAEGTGGDNLAVAWAGPGIGEDPLVISGTFLAPLVRMNPVSPTPENGASDVKPTDRLLRWSPGEDHTAGYWDVYLGTDPAALELVADNKPFASKLYVYTAGFEPGQVYYWRVDPVGTDRTTMGTGDLWSFFVLPETAIAPDPVDWAKNKLTDVELTWRAGANGDFHHVYFGMDRDAVASADKSSPEYQGRTVGTTTTFNPGELERGVTYYWRVDEAKATGAEWQGSVWTFSTLPVLPILDPDLLGWWKLDEGSGNSAIDWSGHENHGEILNLDGGLGDDGDAWLDDPGKGMVLTFNGNDETGALVKAGSIPAIGANDNFTWSFWARQEGDGTGAFETVLGNRDVGVSYPRFIMFTPTKFEYFVNTGEYVINHEAVEGVDYPDFQDGVWTHHALVKEGTNLTYYRDGFETGQGYTDVEQGENTLYIGGDLVSGRWSGAMYNVRIYKRALSVAELETAMRRDPAKAWDPTPVHGRVGDILEASTLTWQPGDSAIEHDVYLGLDAQGVALATPETEGLYRGRQSSTEYTPDDVQMDQTYYWRIDQINSDQSLSQGYVWRFTVTPYLIVDDFERYTNASPNRVFQTWVDGLGFSASDHYPNGNPGNGTGAAVGHDIWSLSSAHYNGDIMETSNTPAGSTQAMPVYYNNAGGSGRSEVDRAFTPGQDWTAGDVTTLVLHVRGEVGNTGQLYCKINGTKVDYNGNSADISSPAWRAWEVDLASVGVNLTNVTTMTIGIEAGQSGVFYIDDIRLYPETLADPGE